MTQMKGNRGKTTTLRAKSHAVTTGNRKAQAVATRSVGTLVAGKAIAVGYRKRRNRKAFTAADEELVVRLAKAAEQTRADPGEDITGISDEDFLAKLFG